MRDVVVILRDYATGGTKLAAAEPVLTRAADEIDRLRKDNARMNAELTLVRCMLGISPIHSVVEAVRVLHDDGREAFEKSRGERCEHWHEWAKA